MPELPEVEVTRLGLIPHIPHRTVKSIWWSGKRLRLPLPQKLLRSAVRNQQFTGIDRRAKYLLFRLTSRAVLVIHLGMTGKLSLLPRETPRAKHDHLCLLLDNNMELRFNDSRRFGSITVWPGDQAQYFEQAFDAKEGIEPMGPHFTAENIHKLAQSRSVSIKAFLMNSKLVSGIGNIYANETLFLSGIHPETPARALSKSDWEPIIKNCVHTLSRAIEAGGTTISDFLGSSGQPGYFQLQLHVYGKEGAPCSCCSNAIVKTVVAGRATFHCPKCQSLPKNKSQKSNTSNRLKQKKKRLKNS